MKDTNKPNTTDEGDSAPPPPVAETPSDGPQSVEPRRAKRGLKDTIENHPFRIVAVGAVATASVTAAVVLYLARWQSNVEKKGYEVRIASLIEEHEGEKADLLALRKTFSPSKPVLDFSELWLDPADVPTLPADFTMLEEGDVFVRVPAGEDWQHQYGPESFLTPMDVAPVLDLMMNQWAVREKRTQFGMFHGRPIESYPSVAVYVMRPDTWMQRSILPVDPVEQEAVRAQYRWDPDEMLVGQLGESVGMAVALNGTFSIYSIQRGDNAIFVDCETVFEISGKAQHFRKMSLLFGTREKVVMVVAHLPSTNGRSDEYQWVMQWLAGLRVVRD